MKHKLLTVLLSLVAVFCLALGITACDGIDSDHNHFFGVWQTIKPPTCVENGIQEHACACGKKEREEIPALGHDFGVYIPNNDATCAENGTKTAICARCSDIDTKIDENCPALHVRYESRNEKYIVSDVSSDCTHSEIHIPMTYMGISVTEIGNKAFADCSWLTSIEIPNSVIKIGDMAFCDCSELTSIEIPDNITEIGDGAFDGTAYYNDVANWDAGVVLYIGNYLIKAKETISGAYTIRKNTTTIGNGAFQTCNKLTNITIPDSVTEIWDEAFSGCSGLTSIKIPGGVTEIRKETFRGCSGLTSVEIPDGVTRIAYYAFSGCSGLKSVTISDNSVTDILWGAFSGCSELTNIVIPDSVIYIADGAFDGTAYYNDIANWDAGVVLYIGNHLIEAKETISGTYTIRKNTKTIGDGAFQYCSGLTNIVIPDSVTEMGENVFRGCSKLTNIQFNGTVDEWEELDGIFNWNIICDYTVTCTDGTIAKDGTVTYFNAQ